MPATDRTRRAREEPPRLVKRSTGQPRCWATRVRADPGLVGRG